jgi:hypothetical protein
MFLILIAGRLVSYMLVEKNHLASSKFSTSQTQFVISVSDVDHVNYLVLFMTCQITFTEHFGGGGNYYVIFKQYLFLIDTFLPVFILSQLAKYRRTVMDLSWQNKKFKTKCNFSNQ